jgi:hypothetical protein
MTAAFYEILFACAGKPVAWDVVQSLNARINHLRAMTISIGRADAPRKTAIQEMYRILDAIRKRDAAYRASVDHVQTVAEIARQSLTSGPGNASPAHLIANQVGRFAPGGKIGRFGSRIALARCRPRSACHSKAGAGECFAAIP